MKMCEENKRLPHRLDMGTIWGAESVPRVATDGMLD